MTSKTILNRKYLSIALAAVLLSAGCKKWYNLPEDLDYFNEKADYTSKEFSPVLGRTTVYNSLFNYNNSSLPLYFEIFNVRNASDGSSASELTEQKPVWVWKQAYDGEEKSLDEINAKRKQENHPLWEVRQSGDFILWEAANETTVPHHKGSSNPDGYLFDVKVSNSGGSKVIKDMVLTPARETPYEPSDLDPLTGEVITVISPTVTNVLGASSRTALKAEDVTLTFTKVGNGNSLTFKFLNKDDSTIDPDKFNETKFAEIIHGFDMDKSSHEYVRYNVAYPIPLVKLPTKYTTSDGSRAVVLIKYSRIGFDGVRESSSIGFNFSIFQQGDWEIAVKFIKESPRFEDEY